MYRNIQACILGRFYCTSNARIIFSNITSSQGSAKIFFFRQWNFARMKNKGEFRIWKRMKYEKVVAKWHSKATGVSFLSSAPERFYHRIRHTLAASVIFHLRRVSDRMHAIPMRLIDFKVNLNYCWTEWLFS